MMPRIGGQTLWLLLSVAVLLLDQLTKFWASAALNYADPVAVMPFFNLTLLHNPGAAFSFLADAGGWQRWLFVLLAITIVVALTIWLMRLRADERWTAFALAMIIGGAIGNLVDRLLHGYVVDFLDFHVGGYHWPAFNIADAAITVGVGILLIISFRSETPSATEQKHQP